MGRSRALTNVVKGWRTRTILRFLAVRVQVCRKKDMLTFIFIFFKDEPESSKAPHDDRSGMRSRRDGLPIVFQLYVR